MNPIFPLNHYIPDVEARVFSDGNIYCYGSKDTAGDLFYCGHSYDVFCSRDGMRSWEVTQNVFSVNGDSFLFAPDCIEKDGSFYLYYCLSGGFEGVAVSNSPTGPFADLGVVEGVGSDGIDPSIFIDDDGEAYYFWGQFSLRGARMNADMKSIDKDTENRALLTEELHGFHEGASIRKRGDIYYMLYTDISRGRATCISYATAKHPLGPYEKGGVIVDNTGCDPQSWNNHGSMEEINGQWYVFYHRSSHCGVYSRRACCEKIYFDENGRIAEVAMSSVGADINLPLDTDISVSHACLIKGNSYIERRYTPSGFCDVLLRNENNSALTFSDVELGEVKSITVYASSAVYSSVIMVHLDDEDGELVAEIPVKPTGDFCNFEGFTAKLNGKLGRHSLYLIIKGINGRLADIKGIRLVTT